LHGLSTFGFAARAILNTVGGGLPSALRYFGARFTAPVVPGDELETSAWEVKKGPDGTTEVAFEVKNKSTGKVRPAQVLMHMSFQLTLLSLRSSLVVDSRELSSRSGQSSKHHSPKSICFYFVLWVRCGCTFRTSLNRNSTMGRQSVFALIARPCATHAVLCPMELDDARSVHRHIPQMHSDPEIRAGKFSRTAGARQLTTQLFSH